MKAARDAGFTLVEALVSLFVFSIVAAGGAAMLMQSVASQRDVAEAHEQLRALQTARSLLMSDASQYVARSVREADGARRPAFIGGDARAAMAFTRAAGEPLGDGGARTRLVYVEYLVRDGDLIRRTRTDLDPTQAADISERVLFKNARDVRFRFYDGAQWWEAWGVGATAGAAPRAIALTATVPRYGEVRLEALVGLGP